MKTIITCRGVARHVTENLDERLGGRASYDIRAHLNRCPNCAAYLDSLKKTVMLYRFFTGPELQTSTRRKLFLALKIS